MPFRPSMSALSAPSTPSRPAVPLATALLTGVLVLLTPEGASATAATSPSVGASPTLKLWPGHPGRHLVGYRVRRGDTATSIATHFHAWTAELLRINHKTRGATWHVGERVVVPVVTARAHPRKATPRGKQISKARVRDEIVRVAKQHGVAPRLALAVAWQESGWQQDVRSSVGAIGTMQVMPGTGKWLSSVVGRKLDLHTLHDNVTAGVVLIKLLRQDHGVRRSLAGYYQGLGSIADHGTYPSTKQYVRNVLTHRARLERGWKPLA